MRLFTSLAVAAIVSCSLQAQVTGTVVTSEGLPFKGATIAAFAPETSETALARLTSEQPQRVPLAQGESGENGRFSLDVKKQPNVHLLITAPRMAPVSLDATAVDDIGAIALRSAPLKSGRITAGGKGVAHAVVRLESDGGEVVLRSDAQGKYEIADPDRWVSRIVVFHPDYALQQRNASFNGKIALDFQLDKGVEIRGKVFAANGETPVASARVWVDGVPLAESNASGSFVVPHAPRGWKEVRVVAGDKAAFRSSSTGELSLRVGKANTISGRVVDSATDQPLVGAPVALLAGGNRFSGRMPLMTVTDAKGTYSFNAIPSDRYTLSANYSGYSSDSSEAALKEGSPLNRRIALTKNARITGAVVDEEKKVVRGVRLRTLSQAPMGMRMNLQPSAAAITAPDGTFVMRNVAPGESLTVEARKKGHPSAKSAALKLGSGEVKRNMLLTLPSGFEVTGRVATSTGEPLAGISVVPTESRAQRGMMNIIAQRPDPEEDIVTGADGTFSLRLAEGTYDFAFKGRGWAMSQRNDVAVRAAMEPIAVAMAPSVEITGRLVNADDTPVIGAQVISFAAAAEGNVVTGGDGGFVLSGLKAGPTPVQFRKEDDLIFEIRTMTAPASDVIVKLENSSAISGRVIDAATKRPVSSFRAGFSGERGNAVMRSFSPPLMLPFRNDDGSFALERVTPGSLQLIVDAPGYVRSSTSVVVPGDAPLKEVEVLLEAGARISGKVTSPDGRGIPGAVLRVEAAEAGSMRGRGGLMTNGAATDASGEYSIDGQKLGEHSIVIEAEGYAPERKTLKVAEGENKLDVKLSRGLSLSGMVVTESGVPVSGAEVTVMSAAAAGRYRNSATSDASGAFSLEGITPGRYSISATKPGLVEAELKDIDAATAGALKLIMKGGGTIVGSVTGLTPDELTSVNVMSPGSGAVATVDGQGRFRIEGVPPGTARVYASLGRFGGNSRRTEQKVVEVVAGSEVEVTLTFDSSIVVTGRVTRDGKAAANVTVIFNPAQPGVGSYSAASTDAAGRYEAVGITNGRYNVIVSDLGRSTSHSVKYEVTGSDTFDIDIRTGTLRGKVVDAETGAAIANAELTIAPSGKQTMMTQIEKRSGADGTFVADSLNEGSFSVTAIKEGYGAVTRTVEIAAGDSRELELEMAKSGGAIVRIVDARDRRALSGALNVLDSMNVAVFSDFVEARADGSIRIPLAAGSYRAAVHSPGYAPRMVTLSVPGAEMQIPMTPGGTLAIVNRGLRVTGRLVQADGTTYPMNFRRDEFVLQPGMSRLEQVAPGSYTLQLLDDRGTVTSSHSVNITEGKTTDFGI